MNLTSSLHNVCEAMAPLYTAIALGYAAGRHDILSQDQTNGINHFVSLFAMPILIFRMIAINNPYEMDMRFILADTLQKLITLILLSIWAKFNSNGSLSWLVTLFSLAAIPNAVIMGVPILQGMYGDISTGLMVQIVAPQLVIWYVLIVFLYEYMAAWNAVADDIEKGGRQAVKSVELQKVGSDTNGNQQTTNADSTTTMTKTTAPSVKVILLMAVKNVLKVSSAYGSVLGLVWSLIAFRFHIKMPSIIDKSLMIISDTTSGLAMFTVGVFMARQKKFISCGYSQAILAMVIKFIVGPGIMVAASLAVGMRGTILNIATVQAGLPLAVICFVCAKHYNQHVDIMSAGISVGTLISVPITILYYVILNLL